MLVCIYVFYDVSKYNKGDVGVYLY